MSGHMGVDQVTIRNLRVLGVDKDENLLVVEGAVPGHERRLRDDHQGEEATERASWIQRLRHGRSVEGFEARRWRRRNKCQLQLSAVS